jgi:plasmid maintenance system antidote protein VapI
MDQPRQDALLRFREAVKASGGPSAVARKAGITRSHLGNILSGLRPLRTETATRLRPHVAADAQVWLDVLAPLSDAPRDEATTC